MIKQCLSYSIIYYFHQMRFASASSTRKKYVNSFNIISITFYILFRPFMNIIEDFFCFEFKEFIPSAISLSGSICAINVGIVKVLFISVSSETFSLGYSAPGVSPFSIWPCGSWLLIKISLSRECVSSAKSPYGSNLILLMFIISWTPRSCNVFWYNAGDLITTLFQLWMDIIKVVHDEQIFFDIQFYLEHGIEVLYLLCDTTFFLPKSSF